jgi:hypothetical protein
MELVRIFTTCPGCGNLLPYQGRRAATHETCTDPFQYEQDLEDDFVAAVTRGDDELADALAAELDALHDGPPRLGDAALAYANWGWPVFPLQPGTKIPFERSHGFKDATTDRRRIRDWWRRWPTANVGLPTGIYFDVLDVDFHHGAAEIWPTLRDSDAMPDAHGISNTAHHGLHVLLEPAGLGNHANMADRPGLDYRGRGGYIVAPPSVLTGGRCYAWDVKPSPVITRAGSRRP